MPAYELKIKMELENLSELQAPEDMNWYIKFQCGSCKEIHEKFSVFSASEEFEVPGGRGTANLVQKCKFCGKNNNSVSVIVPSGKPFTSDDSGFVTIRSFECRGMHPVEFQFMGGWNAVASSGTVFEDVDLSEGEFADFDESADESVSILELESEFK